jgi:putative zinc finger protein
MSDHICTYSGDRAAALIAYLYDEVDPGERAAFDAHLSACAVLGGLTGVRRQLARWAMPDRAPAAAVDVAPPVERRRAWWRDVPAWAQVAAAMLVLGISAGLANLEIRYDANGLSIRTGWSKAAPAARAPQTDAAAAPWRTDLAALEQQLRTEFHAAQVGAASLAPQPARTDADLMRRVKTILEESERRQQRELALRVAEVLQDVSSQRQADMRRIELNLGAVKDKTSVEVLRNRDILNYYVQRVSQRP